MAKARLPLIAALAMTSSLWSDGTTGAEMLRARLAARPAALGDAYAALGDDIASVQINPAGLQALEKIELSFMHWLGIADIAYDSFSYAQPFEFGTLAATLGLRSMPDIDNPLAPDNPVAASDLVLGISYATRPYRMVDFLPELFEESSFGVTIKYLNSRLGDKEANGAAVDLGLRWPLPSRVMLGVALLNLGPPIVFIDEPDPLPTTATVGVARTFELGKVNRLNTMADLEVGMDGQTRIHFGAEDWLVAPLALRVGYVLEDDRNLGGLTAGLGLKLDQDSLTLGIDYAFKPFYYQGFDSFDAQHLVSALLRF